MAIPPGVDHQQHAIQDELRKELYMHSVTIYFGPQATAVRLMFKTADAAQKAADAVGIGVCDDFGQRFRSAQVHGVMVEDLGQSKNAAIEFEMHVYRLREEIAKRVRGHRNLAASGGLKGGAVFSQ